MNMTESSPSENLRIYRWYKPPVLLFSSIELKCLLLYKKGPMDRITTMLAKIKRIILVAKINAFGCNTSTTISKLVNLLQAFYNLLLPSVQAFYNLPHSANGTRYEGDFKDDKCHGKGVYTWPEIESYFQSFPRINEYLDGTNIL